MHHTNPMGTRRTKRSRAADALRILDAGPSFLQAPGREAELAQFKLWASTWVAPVIRELMPPYGGKGSN
jgi:hypothetical protein